MQHGLGFLREKSTETKNIPDQDRTRIEDGQRGTVHAGVEVAGDGVVVVGLGVAAEEEADELEVAVVEAVGGGWRRGGRGRRGLEEVVAGELRGRRRTKWPASALARSRGGGAPARGVRRGEPRGRGRDAD